MISCHKLTDITFKEFYNKEKASKNSLLIGKITLVKWEKGHYYGLKLSTGEEIIVKCIETTSNNKEPLFESVGGSLGYILIEEILWEKSPEEMFKPDCCNG